MRDHQVPREQVMTESDARENRRGDKVAGAVFRFGGRRKREGIESRHSPSQEA